MTTDDRPFARRSIAAPALVPTALVTATFFGAQRFTLDVGSADPALLARGIPRQLPRDHG